MRWEGAFCFKILRGATDSEAGGAFQRIPAARNGLPGVLTMQTNRGPYHGRHTSVINTRTDLTLDHGIQTYKY